MLKHKTLKRKTRTLFAITLALVLALGTFTVALADVPQSTGDADDPADAAITKVLQMPEGTTIPATKFTFDITPISVDGSAYSATVTDPGYMPTLADVDIEFDASYISGATGAFKTTSSGVTKIIQESDPLFANVTFTHAGIYTYTVKETADTNSGIDDAEDEFLTYSETEYTLTLWVKERTGGGYYIAIITADNDTTNSDPAVGKVDPTPGGDGEDYDYSQMIFTNSYWKINGDPEDPDDPDPETDDAVLYISKEVAGDYASSEEYFTFNVTLTVPTFITDTDYYACVLDEDGDAVTLTSTGNGAKDGTGTDNSVDYFKFTTSSGVATKTIKLKHGEKLVFFQAPVGMAYTAVEAASTVYTASVDVYYGGALVGGTDNGAVNTALSTDGTSGSKLVGETTAAASHADFTNTREEITPTGIIMNNLPYVGLILLAVAALIAYIAVKSKKRV